MLAQTLIFEENEKNFYIIDELNSVFNNDEMIRHLLKTKEVSRFVELSRRLVNKESLNGDELTEFNELLNNDNVKLYLENIDDILKKKQFFKFSILGGALSLPLVMINPVLAILGIIGSGLVVGTTATKVASVLRRWKTVEEYRRWITGMKQNTSHVELSPKNSLLSTKKMFS